MDDLAHLLLSVGGQPLESEGLPLRSAPALEEADRPQTELLWSEVRPANDLAAQRWGIVAPMGALGDRLLEAVQPLVAHREAEQGAPVAVWRVAPTLDFEQAVAWRRRVFDPRSGSDAEVPRYQLILGDLHEVPLSVQLALGSDGFTGRIAFDSLDDYRTYAEKVIRCERHASPRGPASAQISVATDPSAASVLARTWLGDPLTKALRDRIAEGFVEASGVTVLTSGANDFARGGPSTGSGSSVVRLTVCHGEGPPPRGWSHPSEARRRQGALSFGGGEVVSASDLVDLELLPGGFWILMACYGGGTPKTSLYAPWLASLGGGAATNSAVGAVLAGLPSGGEAPFVAAIPKAVLSNPLGPLGVLCHVDLAWASSFLETSSGMQSRVGRLQTLMEDSLQGARFGVARRSMVRSVLDLDHQILASQMAGGRVGDSRLLRSLWMARQDLVTYVLLGDPAARLPHVPKGGAPHAPGGWASLLPGLDARPTKVPFEGGTAVERAVCAVILNPDMLREEAARLRWTPERLQDLAQAWMAAGRAVLQSRLA